MRLYPPPPRLLKYSPRRGGTCNGERLYRGIGERDLRLIGDHDRDLERGVLDLEKLLVRDLLNDLERDLDLLGVHDLDLRLKGDLEKDRERDLKVLLLDLDRDLENDLDLNLDLDLDRLNDL